MSALAGAAAPPLTAQTTGTILGRVIDATTREPLVGAGVQVVNRPLRTGTDQDGRFVLAAVPAGEQSLRIELIGYQPLVVEQVAVRAGRATELRLELQPGAVELEGIRVDAERVRLIEPDIAVSREIVVGRELRQLPVDAIEQAVELAPGVSEGHFRGGRVGQEVHVIDGVAVKNQLDASVRGFGLEFSPTALEEVEVVTGGFGAEYGSALSGVVSYVTRRGDPERWQGQASITTDHWAPDPLFRGFTGLSLSAGGPLRFLGGGTTLFADLLAQGMLDAQPRARGLSCLRPEDATASSLQSSIRQLADSAGVTFCPHETDLLPHQRGDKLIGFVRLDRPIAGGTTITASLLRNRRQEELYTSEFKYNPLYQLGERTTGSLAMLSLDWTRHRQGSAIHLTGRGALMRLDRYLGVVDPASFDGARLAGFTFGDYQFLGEDFARSSVNTQLEVGSAIPGYLPPTSSVGSPFGIAGEGIFFTEGTPGIANWTRTDMASADVVGEVLSARGHAFSAGSSARFYRVESYERIQAYFPGSAPTYARFFPGTLAGFAEARLAASDDITIQAGVRLEAFRSGLSFRRNRADFLEPAVDTEWRLSLMPRLGVALPVPGSGGRTALRFNFGRVAQPPDFQFFLDSSLGDSLRTDIRRQGNPNLSFERGTSYEVGLSRLLGEHVGLSAVGFIKQLDNLVAGTATVGGAAPGTFSTSDFGTVRGLELGARARWPGLSVRAAYTLQKATGVASGALEDTLIDPTGPRQEFPLAFDRRHAVDLALFVGGAAGAPESPWSGSLTTAVQSGYPFDRFVAGERGDTATRVYLPWTAHVNLRVSREIPRIRLCARCDLRVMADARNVLGLENIRALRRSTGEVAPAAADVEVVAAAPAPPPIPRESPAYSTLVDADGDGVISPAEYRRARIGAALDWFDPSLFFGEARQVRLGVEVTF